ncbi:MAG: Archaetidylinositol phosphate synthase [Methanosaeta sp. PtaU1.Bin028]|nr:MAG: Archaetidylinositol phosphate synthase [Methanosaeta sp. PtaU1.Bin028]
MTAHLIRSRILDKERSDRLLAAFSHLGLHPIAWTLLSLPLAAGGLAALAYHNLSMGLALFLLSGAVDMIDGAVARSTGQSTALGAFLDGVLDRYVEVLLILGLALHLGEGDFLGLPLMIWYLLLVFGSLMTSFVRAYADHRDLVKDEADLNRMGGLLERGERLILLYAGIAAGMYSREALLAAVAATALLSNATALQRILTAVRYAEGLARTGQGNGK